MLVAWFAAFGFLSAYGPVLVAHGKALFSPHQVGRGLTVLNMGTMGGTFLAQAVSGFVIGMFPTGPDGAYELAAYRLVFALHNKRAPMLPERVNIAYFSPCYLCVAVYVFAVR